MEKYSHFIAKEIPRWEMLVKKSNAKVDEARKSDAVGQLAGMVEDSVKKFGASSQEDRHVKAISLHAVVKPTLYREVASHS